MQTTESIVARGMIFFGSRDSSPYIAVDSKPTHDKKAKNRPMPALPETARVDPALDGSVTVSPRVWQAFRRLSDPRDQPWGTPTVKQIAQVKRASMSIPGPRKIPSNFAGILTGKD